MGKLKPTVQIIREMLGKMEGQTRGHARAAAAAEEDWLVNVNTPKFAARMKSLGYAKSGRDPIPSGGGEQKGDQKKTFTPAVWTAGRHDHCELPSCCNLSKTQREHLRKDCPHNPTPGKDPMRKAKQPKRDEKKKRKGAASGVCDIHFLPLPPYPGQSQDRGSEG